MEPKTVIIFILVGYLIFWYLNPDKGKVYIDNAYNGIKNGIIQLTTTQQECQNNYDPVCSGNQTFRNACQAAKAGKTNATMGVC